MNFNPVIELAIKILSLYNSMVGIWLVATLLIYFGIINHHQPFVRKMMDFLNRLVQPALDKIRKYMPPIAGIDISVVILYLIINFISNVLYTYFYVTS